MDVSRDRAAATELVRRTGQQGVPVIEVGGRYIVGFDRPRLEQALAALPRTGAASARPTFGAAIADAAKHASTTAGAYVGRVRPETPAARAGLRPGDIIVALDDRPVRTAAEAEAALGTHHRGDTVRVGYLRDGERRSGSATFS